MKTFLTLLFGLIGCLGLAVLAPPAEAARVMDPDMLSLPLLGGMIINKANLEAVFLNLKTTFNKAFEAAPSDWEKTTMKVPSGSSQNNYNWLSRFPKMRRWLGDKMIKSLSAFGYTIVNEDFEATVEVDRNDIDDDTLGIYGPMAQEAGFSSKQLPDELDAELKNGAFAAACYDGQYFYDTDHPVGNGVEVEVASVSNLKTAVLSAATLALVEASYGALRHAIMGFTDDEGRPLGLVPDLLEVPPALEGVANIIAAVGKLQDNSPNPYKGTCTVKVNPRLTSATAYMLHVTNRPLKPFVYQERKAPVFVSAVNPDSDDVFMRKKFKYGAEARAAGGYGLWQLSAASTGAG
jgi:phage major head subunit gpT-like protein